MTVFLIFLGLVLLTVLFIWILYNSLVTAGMRVKESWSGIDVQLKRRGDLIPNLVETVKAYAKHEKGVFENVTKARSALVSASSPEQLAQANNQLTSALKSLFAVAESYPELKASENFKSLQEELSDTESKIAYARQFYNSNVLDYNTKVQIFPNFLLASIFGFKQEEFFQASEEAREVVKVDFEK